MNGVHKHTMWAGALTVPLIVLIAIAVALAVPSRTTSASTDLSGGPFRGRAPHLDNAKFFLMCVVVTVHVQHATPYWRWNKQLRLFIGVFCTRTFGFISGIVSQDLPSLKSFKGLVFKLITPLLFYIVLIEPIALPLSLGSWYTSWNEYTLRIVSNITKAQAGATWYMFALIHWRIWGWMLQQLKPAWRLLLALVLAGVAGYTNLDSFKLVQAITSFPLYVAGQLFPYRYVMERFQWNFSTALVGFCVLLAMGAVGATEEGRSFLEDIPYWGWTASEIRWEPERDACGQIESALVWVRGLFRTVWELCKTVVFLILVCPRSHLGLISDLGAQTLYPFLLHYTFVELENRFMHYSLREAQYGNVAWAGVWLAQFAAIFLLVTVLSSWPVRKIFQPLFEPSWLERLLTSSPTEGQGEDAKSGRGVQNVSTGTWIWSWRPE